MKCSRCKEEIPKNKIKCIACGMYNDPTISTIGSSITLDKVISADDDRINLGIWAPYWGESIKSKECGVVRTSVSIIGGSPGAGKSTLLLQLLDIISENEKRESLYIATEEALPEIKLRADRLEIKNQRLLRMMPAKGGIDDLGEIIKASKPCSIVIDSLQGMTGHNDNLAVIMCSIAKSSAVALASPVFIISQVNKAEEIEGLNAVQHEVDTTLTFTVDSEGIRTLTVIKNRFGEAYLELNCAMTAKGLVPLLED